MLLSNFGGEWLWFWTAQIQNIFITAERYVVGQHPSKEYQGCDQLTLFTCGLPKGTFWEASPDSRRLPQLLCRCTGPLTPSPLGGEGVPPASWPILTSVRACSCPWCTQTPMNLEKNGKDSRVGCKSLGLSTVPTFPAGFLPSLPASFPARGWGPLTLGCWGAEAGSSAAPPLACFPGYWGACSFSAP